VHISAVFLFSMASILWPVLLGGGLAGYAGYCLYDDYHLKEELHKEIEFEFR
jgi:hypothetical protein